jgi:hypothetical protein
MTILAGAASLVTLAGGALLEVANWRDTEPERAQIHPAAAPAAPIARAAANVRTVAWTLKPLVDRALLKAAAPTAVQTASKAATPSAKSAPVQPAFKKAAPETVQFVAKPFIPNAAPAPQPVLPAPARASIQAPPRVTAIHTGDPRPDALFQQKRGQGDGAFSGRVASGGKPAATPKSNSAAQAPAAARTGKTTGAGSGDPRGEATGGAQAASDAGGETNSDAGGGNDAAAGEGGSAPGDGNAGGADAGDSGGADPGGAESGDGGSDVGDGVGGNDDAGPAGDAPGNAADGESGAENDDAASGN